MLGLQDISLLSTHSEPGLKVPLVVVHGAAGSRSVGFPQGVLLASIPRELFVTTLWRLIFLSVAIKVCRPIDFSCLASIVWLNILADG